MIVSPLNYPGNKARILEQIIDFFPKNIYKFVDVFCGSGIVGLNSKCINLILNDGEYRIIKLLEYFKKNNIDEILRSIEEIIKKYNLTDSKNKPKNFYKIYKNEGLSNYNKEGYLRLRNSYNNNPSSIKFFMLIIYSFNHYIRFNSKNLFNVPVGKMDFSDSLLNKTIEFILELQNKDIQFLNLDFRDKSLYETGDFFYFDPPYLITQAPYNLVWNKKDEQDLYGILDKLNSLNLKFALSNVIISNGKTNDILKIWSKKYNINEIKRQYANANYRRKNLSKSVEVLITNY